MKKAGISFVFLFLTLTCLTGWAQQYNFKRFTTKNGLPNPFINHIFCDSKGFMWMSTQGGLSKFDGNSFINYTSREGLPSSDILCVGEDATNDLWIGTNGAGLAVFNGSTFKIYSTKNGLPNNFVYGIHKDSKNNVWLATQGGISRYADGKFKNYGLADGLKTLEFFSITEAADGKLWFGCKDFGVACYDPATGKFSHPNDPALDKKIFFSIYADKQGTIWAGTPGMGLWYMKKGQGFVPFEDERISREFISAIREDDHHNLWIGTDNQLVKINGSKKAYYTIENGLTSNTVYSLGFDHDGKLWIGTINGLNVFVNEAFTNYNEKNGLTNNNITVFCKDRNNNLIIGTAGNGINIYDGTSIKQLDIPALNQSNVLCLLYTSTGEIYAGLNSSEHALIILEPSGNTYKLKSKIKKLSGKAFPTVTGLVELKNNEIIVAGYGQGLWSIKGDEVTEIYDSTLFNSRDYMTIFGDSKNNLWISVYQNGLIKYNQSGNGPTFTRFTTKEGLGDNTIHSICEDRSGNIFLGNYENGITIYNQKKFVTYNSKDGLCSNNIQAVSCDNRNNIWIGTGNGLNRMMLTKDLKIASLKLFNETNGLLGTEINQNGLYIDHDNMLWLGSNNGLTRYNSSLDYKNTIPPALALNGIKLNFLTPNWKALDMQLDPRTGLPVDADFSYNNNHLTFYFQALTIDQVEFSYMLEGLDDKWTPLSEKNEADFTNIPPGKYVFKVRGKNSDGVWSTNNPSFAFTISPPFWQTWWFRIAAGLLIIALIIVVFKWRTAQLAREKKILEEKVAARTHELSVSNAHLSVALGDIKDSIHYAQKIQQSILPDDETFTGVMPDAFVLFKPKDIVSGDFYWVQKTQHEIIYATCDCTGHGVPGGFMTMLGTSFLNEIVNEKKHTQPDTVLNEMRDKIIEALKQTGLEGENKDGMDMVFCNIRPAENQLTYAAANNGFYIVRNGELLEMKADKQPIGYFSAQAPFKKGEFKLEKGDVIYTFTDGYADQFGGPKGKKFKYKQLEELLVAHHQKPMHEQKEILDQAIENWMKDYEQVDDILVIGYRV